MTAATIAWKQISIMTKMACGAREATSHGENRLTFKVHTLPMRFIEVEYDPALDLYTVEYFRIKRSKGARERVSLEKFELVYGDMLSEMIYKMVNK